MKETLLLPVKEDDLSSLTGRGAGTGAERDTGSGTARFVCACECSCVCVIVCGGERGCGVSVEDEYECTESGESVENVCEEEETDRGTDCDTDCGADTDTDKEPLTLADEEALSET